MAGQPQRAIDLMNFMWADFMLDDPRMTNSTFIEGYSTDGSLHYAPYTNDARVSHAHGWATGPTSTLSMYVAGIQPLTAEGKTWKMAPRPANLTSVEAGFSTSLGNFTAKLDRFNGTCSGASTANGFTYHFSAPANTTGSLSIDEPGCEGSVALQKMCSDRWESVGSIRLVSGMADIYDLPGGTWQAKVICSESS